MDGALSQGKVSSGIRQGCPLSPYLFVLVLSVILGDVESDLLQQGQPTNTWSVGFPTFDLEYADDTLLLGITTPQLTHILRTLEGIAAEYGMKLNQDKTELLTHPDWETPKVQFSDGTLVKTTTQVKYLGCKISWKAPFESAFIHRLQLAEQAYKKLRLVWNSSLKRKVKVKIFQATFLPVLLYGLDSLTLTTPQLRRIDAQYLRFLRRSIGIKASYYSRIPNQEVWRQAGHPTLPSGRLHWVQYKRFVAVFQSDMQDPIHNVVFNSPYKDRILNQGRRKGMQFPYWIEVMSQRYFPDHTASRGPLGPHSHYADIAKLVRSSSFELAPKRAMQQKRAGP